MYKHHRWAYKYAHLCSREAEASVCGVCVCRGVSLPMPCPPPDLFRSINTNDQFRIINTNDQLRRSVWDHLAYSPDAGRNGDYAGYIMLAGCYIMLSITLYYASIMLYYASDAA
jgi:hypothetical protein